MTYRNWPNLFWGFFCSLFSFNSVDLAYRQSGTSTLDGFYTKQLLSIAWVILDQEIPRNFTGNCIIALFVTLEAIFCMCTCIHVSWKVGLKLACPQQQKGVASANKSKPDSKVLHKETQKTGTQNLEKQATFGAKTF